ncbi:MAG: SDR family oxidoreductase [Spirochaetia bacterium]|nr:SDR family oxidoreductase [Spirochaetia bacterium]
MSKRTVVITGGTGGLGRAVTAAFVGANWRIVIPVEKAADGASVAGPSVTTIEANVTNEKSVSGFFETAAKDGGLHALVHLVGGFTGGPTLDETDVSDWDRMSELNARSTFLCLKHAIKHMKQGRYGRIVTVGARPALDGVAGLGPYAASKAAVIALTKTAAHEGRAFGITANVVVPSTIDTPANRASMPDADFSAWVAPANLAGMIAVLASEAGADTSGAVIPVYGRA